MRATTLFFSLSLALPVQLATAQTGSYELAFCAQVGSYPMAERGRGGFDVEIATLLAEELGATPTFTWTQFDDIGIRDTLHSGICDAAVGVGEGVAEMLTTVPYLNASFAFVTRTADDIIIESLDDPRVRELRIGTYQSAIPTIALRNRGIVENVKEYAAIVRPTGVDAHSPILDGLLSEEVDVAIVYGPFAAARASEESGELTVTVLQPEVDLGAALLQLSRILTIGVRSQDEALRDDLNRALANRWDDVNAILDAYGIPRFDVSRPRVSDELAGATKIGAIFPAGTPAALPDGPVGDDALRGIRVAENVLSERGATTTGFLVLRAHAPTLESIERAARRMVAVDGVNALVGGYTPAAALALATIATELHVPFFNVGSESDALRSPTCFPHTFHIAPSTSMMVVGSLATIGNRAASVFAVLERDGYEDETTQFIERVLAANGADLTGSVVVEPDQFVFYPLLQEIGSTETDTVLVVMGSDSQEVFMGQAASLLPSMAIIGVSPVRGQSRPYLERFRQSTPGTTLGPRVVAWDPAFESPINETYSARTGEPMEAAAWTTYAAIVTAWETSRAGALDSAETVAAFLLDPSTAIEVGKSTMATFREDGQMLQELFVIEADSEARWGRTAAARRALATVSATVSAETTAGALLPSIAACEAP